MSAEDLHEVQFEWPHPEPNIVIVTGTFDDWSSSIYLTKTPAGFEGTTKIPWGQKIKFKYIVDGKWIVHEDQPTEIDPGGFVNNVYNAPPHPSNADVAEPVIEDVQPTTNGHLTNGHTLVAKILENPAKEPAGESAADDKPIEDLAKAEDKIVADTNTIVARDGTSSALDYVASGLGAAMHGVVGVDPINIQKIAIPTPVSDEGFTLPTGQESVPVTAELAPDSVPPSTVDPDIPVSPLAPRVRITIVPVNAAENNTVSSSPPAAEIISPIPIIEAGPTVVVTEPSPPPAGPQIKSEASLTPISPVVEADAQLSAEVEQGKVDSVEQETFSSSKGPAPTLSVTGPEPVRAATESVTVPVAAEPAVEPEPTTATEAIPTTAPSEADVPAAAKVQPESSSTASESTREPKATPTATEPFPATTKVPDETTAVRDPTTVAAPVSDVVHVEEGLPGAAVAEPAVEEQVADTKLEEIKPNPEPIIEPVPTTIVENVKPVESLFVVQQSLREFSPVSQEFVSEPSVESIPVITEGTDAVAVDEIKPVPPPDVTYEVGKPSASELKADEVVEPIPTAVVAAVEARVPPEVNEPVAPEPSATVDEVTLTKEHGQANGSTTTDPGDGHGALPAATASTREAVTHAEKFPSASTSHPVSEDNTPSSSKFNSTRKKRSSLFGKLKNIFHQDKEKEKK